MKTIKPKMQTEKFFKKRFVNIRNLTVKNCIAQQKRVLQGKRSNFEETVHQYGDEKLTEV